MMICPGIRQEEGSREAVLEDLSGRWCGFWTLPTDRGFHRMELTLQLGGGSIAGGGNDEVGRFTIAGGYELASGRCCWAKTYAYHTIQYEGIARSSVISGRWHQPGASRYWSGDFRLWPEGLVALAEEFFLGEG